MFHACHTCQRGLPVNVPTCQRAKRVPSSHFYVPTCQSTCQCAKGVPVIQLSVPKSQGVPIFQVGVPMCQRRAILFNFACQKGVPTFHLSFKKIIFSYTKYICTKYILYFVYLIYIFYMNISFYLNLYTACKKPILKSIHHVHHKSWWKKYIM